VGRNGRNKLEREWGLDCGEGPTAFHKGESYALFFREMGLKVLEMAGHRWLTPVILAI
jgi:hypothetical protein